MSRTCTYVFHVPRDKNAPSPFFDELHALLKKHSAELVSHSASDEMAYADELATALAEHIGEMGVEELRQEFERSERAQGKTHDEKAG